LVGGDAAHVVCDASPSELARRIGDDRDNLRSERSTHTDVDVQLVATAGGWNR
jgi:hypothetical protein